MKLLRLILICCGGMMLLIMVVLLVSRCEPAKFPFLAYSRSVLNGSHIYVAWADGTHIRRISNANQFNHTPLWSADGQRIAYQSLSPEGDVWITVQRLYEKQPSRQLADLP